MNTTLFHPTTLVTPRTTRLERLAVALLAVTAATALVQTLGLLLRVAPPANSFSAWIAGLLS
jgi:hypothetical protein